MYQDFKDLLSAFHAHSVNYLIIGGFAVALHAQPRATKDLDVCLYPHFNSYTVISGGEPKRTGEKMVPMPRLT